MPENQTSTSQNISEKPSNLEKNNQLNNQSKKKESAIVVAIFLILVLVISGFFGYLNFQNRRNLTDSREFLTQSSSNQSVSNSNDVVYSSKVSVSSQSSSSITLQEKSVRNRIRLEQEIPKFDKIDVSQKPLALVMPVYTTHLLINQKGDYLLPGQVDIENEDNVYSQPEPIYIEQERTVYFPYSSGYVAKVNIDTGEVKWDKFDFEISQMSLFNGNYYFTEHKESCNSYAPESEKCRILEISRKDTQKRRVLKEVYNSSIYVAFVDSKNFWLTEGLVSGGEAASTKVMKYALNGEFVEGWSLDFFLSYEESGMCPNEWIYKYTKDLYSYMNNDFYDKEKEESSVKEYWKSPYIGCKTVEDLQRAKGDKTPDKIFNSKFPFALKKIRYDTQKEIFCGNFTQKYIDGGDYRLLYNGEKYNRPGWSYGGNLVECIQ